MLIISILLILFLAIFEAQKNRYLYLNETVKASSLSKKLDKSNNEISELKEELESIQIEHSNCSK